MSTRLGAAGGAHDIDLEHTAAELEKFAHGRFTYPVDWPHLWSSGDNVVIGTKDGLRYVGMVLEVSTVTKAVLIEIDPRG